MASHDGTSYRRVWTRSAISSHPPQLQLLSTLTLDSTPQARRGRLWAWAQPARPPPRGNWRARARRNQNWHYWQWLASLPSNYQYNHAPRAIINILIDIIYRAELRHKSPLFSFQLVSQMIFNNLERSSTRFHRIHSQNDRLINRPAVVTHHSPHSANPH